MRGLPRRLVREAECVRRFVQRLRRAIPAPVAVPAAAGASGALHLILCGRPAPILLAKEHVRSAEGRRQMPDPGAVQRLLPADVRALHAVPAAATASPSDRCVGTSRGQDRRLGSLCDQSSCYHGSGRR